MMVCDDDIVIDAARLNALFEVRAKFRVRALQPAFEPSGKLSYAVTRVQPGNNLRYTDFIEMACPLFSTPSLTAFLDVLDDRLSDYGIDYWFLQMLEANRYTDRVAVVDAITVNSSGCCSIASDAFADHHLRLTVHQPARLPEEQLRRRSAPRSRPRDRRAADDILTRDRQSWGAGAQVGGQVRAAAPLGALSRHGAPPKLERPAN